jgi:hypothetical protein
MLLPTIQMFKLGFTCEGAAGQKLWMTKSRGKSVRLRLALLFREP